MMPMEAVSTKQRTIGVRPVPRTPADEATSMTRAISMVLILLNQKGIITAAEIGSKLGVSPRSVYRYAASIRAAGFDIRGDRGAGFMIVRKPPAC